MTASRPLGAYCYTVLKEIFRVHWKVLPQKSGQNNVSHRLEWLIKTIHCALVESCTCPILVLTLPHSTSTSRNKPSAYKNGLFVFMD